MFYDPSTARIISTLGNTEVCRVRHEEPQRKRTRRKKKGRVCVCLAPCDSAVLMPTVQCYLVEMCIFVRHVRVFKDGFQVIFLSVYGK